MGDVLLHPRSRRLIEGMALVSHANRPILASPVRWNLHALADADLPARCEAAFAALTDAPPALRLAALTDPRDLHRALFAPLAPPDLPQAAGSYRGTAGSALMGAERAVFLARRKPGLRARDPCLPASDVAAAMQALARRTEQLWDRPPQGDAAFAALAEVTQRFFHIHPFLDGNGHVLRILLPLLADRLAIPRKPSWTLHARPYDHHMSLCLQWYPDHPDLLACQLRRWFG